MSKNHRTIVGRFALAAGMPEQPAPEGWRWVPLQALARLESGHTPSRRHPEYWDGEIPWIGIADARENNKGYIHDTAQHVTEAGLENSSARLLPANTVCLSRTASVGYCVIMARPMATSQDFVDWICGPELDPEFLMWLFLAERDEGLKRFGKGTTHTTIYFTEVKRFHVCIPDIKTQRAIVQRINRQRDRVLAAQEALSPTPDLIEKFRQSVLAAAFRGDLTKEWREQNPDVEPASVLLERIRDERRERWIEDAAEKGRAKAEAKARKTGKLWTDEDDEKVLAKERVKAAKKYKEPEPVDPTGLPELPETWCWARLPEVGDSALGKMLDRSKHTTGRSLPYLRNINVRWDGIEVDDLLDMYFKPEEIQRYSVQRGDVLVCEGGEPGRAAIWDDDESIMYQKALHRVRLAAELDGKWLMYRLWLDASTGMLSRLFTGTTIKHLTGSSLSKYALPVAPPAEMAEVLSVVERALAQNDALASRTRMLAGDLERLESSILAKAFMVAR